MCQRIDAFDPTQINFEKKAFLSKLMIILVSAVFSFGSRLLILQSRVLQWASFFVILEMPKISCLKWRIKKGVIWWYMHLYRMFDFFPLQVNCLFFPPSIIQFFYFLPLFSPVFHIFICFPSPHHKILFFIIFTSLSRPLLNASLSMNWWYCSPRDRNESCISETSHKPVQKKCRQNLLKNWSLRYFSYT